MQELLLGIGPLHLLVNMSAALALHIARSNLPLKDMQLAVKLPGDER